MRWSFRARESEIATIDTVFARLLAAYGPQHWWPAETPFEIAVGAVLVQRTAWHNAERALSALRSKALLDPVAIERAGPDSLRPLIRPAGFANSKAEYLHALARFFVRSGGMAQLGNLSTPELRARLMAVRGVGPETADSILLYLFERPVWIVDAYANRLLSRVSGLEQSRSRQTALLSPWIEAGRAQALQELHALIVAHGKARCRKQPICPDCPLLTDCHAGSQTLSAAP